MCTISLNVKMLLYESLFLEMDFLFPHVYELNMNFFSMMFENSLKILSCDNHERKGLKYVNENVNDPNDQ